MEVAFLHIPKTAGTFINQKETDNQSVIYPIKALGHRYVIHKKGEQNVIYLNHDLKCAKNIVIMESQIKKYIIFTNIRNIFDWLVSYASHAGGWNTNYNNPNHYDYKAANKSFEYLIKTIVNRDKQWPNRKFIYCQTFSSAGNLIIDWVNNTKTLDSDLELMAKNYNLKYVKRERQRLGNRKDYREYYNDKLIDLVYKTWKREFDLYGFGYDIENKNSYLRHKISTKNKKCIKYNYKEDQLIINNKIVE
ncbi:MAG: hypothetical protein ABIE68_03825 [bacterium]